MTWQYSEVFLPYTIAAVSSEMVDYEAARLPILDEHPYIRSWRTNNVLGAQSVLLDVGAPLADAGFESGNLSPSWAGVVGSQGAGDSAGPDTGHLHSGTYAMRVTCASGNTFGRYQTVPVVPGVTYTLTGWIRVQTLTGGTVNLDVFGRGVDTNGIQIGATNAAFTKYSDTVTIPLNTRSVDIRFYGQSSPNFVAYLDDVSLVPQVGAIGLYNTNAPTIAIATANPGESFVFLPGTPFTLAKWWAYYRACWVLSPVIAQELISVQTPGSGWPLDGANYWEIGSIQFLPALKTLPANPDQDSLRETLSREYERDGGIPSAAGPFYLQQEMQIVVDEYNTGNMQGLRDLALLGEGTPFLLYENNGKPEQTYIYTRENDVSLEYRGKTVQANPRFVERV